MAALQLKPVQESILAVISNIPDFQCYQDQESCILSQGSCRDQLVGPLHAGPVEEVT